MSIEVMRRVWAHSKHGGAELLALLAIADHENDQGIAWPSVGTLAQKIRMSERNTRYLIAKLEKSGELVIERGKGPHGCNLFRVQTLPGANVAGLQAVAAEGCNGLQGGAAIAIAPESSVNHQGITKPKSANADSLPCPVEKIIDAYHRLMPNNPKCKVISATRIRAIKARWKEAAKLTCDPFGYSTVEDGVKAWEEFFSTCADSLFLTGRVEPSPGRAPFKAKIDFLMRPDKFANCLENTYHQDPPASRKPIWIGAI